VGAVVVPAAFAALFFALPFAAILERGLRQDGRLSFPSDVVFSRETAQLVWFTTWQAAASTALTMALGLPLAWVVGRFTFRGQGLVRALVLVPFVLPTVVVATAFLALLPERLQHGVWAILAAHVFFNIAVVVHFVGSMIAFMMISNRVSGPLAGLAKLLQELEEALREATRDIGDVVNIYAKLLARTDEERAILKLIFARLRMGFNPSAGANALT
jgi:thiamine transport system permease protein